VAVSIYATFATKREADRISGALLEARLVACANSFPIASKYWWKGRIESGRETAVIFKTTDRNARRVIDEVKRLHSYEVPCIVAWKFVAAHGKYLAWVESEARGPKRAKRRVSRAKKLTGK
jgi:periplasmic divalent cation tolerance protein